MTECEVRREAVNGTGPVFIWPREAWGKEALRLARQAVHKAIRRGDLIRPDACVKCGLQAGDVIPWPWPLDGMPPRVVGLIHAHHHKGYAHEHWLDVQWLCRSCHVATDRHDAVERSGWKPFDPLPGADMAARRDYYARVGCEPRPSAEYVEEGTRFGRHAQDYIDTGSA
jgi:hypothetical protein